MGGRFYTNETEISSEQNIDNTFSAEVNVDRMWSKLVMWTESLKDYRNWDCIEFNNPVNADCDFFATAIDVNHYSKNDFLTCQILKTDEDKLNPSIIIMLFKKTFDHVHIIEYCSDGCRLKDSNDFPPVIGHNFHDIESDHELKVGIFSYCSKDNCYLNLPNFTFCTLIISDPKAYISLPLNLEY
ncbi:unnamed protein product [Rhizophagus irregularis]|nr:unnamed protein product [Rhizophagus irregularis]